MNKEINSKVLRIDPYEIRSIVSQYYDMHGKNCAMYKAYVTGYNMLYDDLKRTKSFNNPESFHLIVEKAGNNIQQLHQRAAANCEQIGVFTSHFLGELSDRIDKEKADAKSYLMWVQNTWHDAFNNCYLANGIELIRMQTHMINLVMTQIEAPFFGNIQNLVLGSLNKVEHKIISAAKKYRTYEGLSNAHSFALENGHLIPHDEFLNKVNMIEDTRSWYGPKNKTLHELITYGFNLDLAIKIRFANLVDLKGKTSGEAYDIIYKELEEMGFKAEEELPKEPKNLIDQTNRYKKKRIKELKKINRKNN